jgi:hypothetical protein
MITNKEDPVQCAKSREPLYGRVCHECPLVQLSTLCRTLRQLSGLSQRERSGWHISLSPHCILGNMPDDFPERTYGVDHRLSLQRLLGRT